MPTWNSTGLFHPFWPERARGACRLMVGYTSPAPVCILQGGSQDRQPASHPCAEGCHVMSVSSYSVRWAELLRRTIHDSAPRLKDHVSFEGSVFWVQSTWNASNPSSRWNLSRLSSAYLWAIRVCPHLVVPKIRVNFIPFKHLQIFGLTERISLEGFLESKLFTLQ